MKSIAVALMSVAVTAAIAVAPAGAQTARPTLHVNDAYSSCFFDLHPELTQAEFREFAAELGSILRFRQLGDPAPLGRKRVEVSLQLASTPIDEAKGAWNNTMSHPTADHYLGTAIAFPRLTARFGVTDRMDLGVWGGLDPHANYGIVGMDTKVALLRQGPDRPVTVAIRPSVTTLLGPSEVWAGNASIDLSVSRAFGALSPYVGIATSGSIALERSADVMLDPATAEGAVAYAGLAYRWRAVLVSAEIENASLPSYAVRVGTRF